VATHGHKTPAASPDCLGQGVAADLCHGAIDDAGEFIHDGEFGCLCQGSGKRDAELLAVRENVIWLEPGRRGREADAGKQSRDVVDAHSGGEAVHDALILRPGPATHDVVAEEFLCDRGLAASGRPHDQANLPGLVEREVDTPFVLGPLNGCIVFSLAVACVLHAILAAWGRGRRRKDESKPDGEEH
jgi:hypothetical protein